MRMDGVSGVGRGQPGSGGPCMPGQGDRMLSSGCQGANSCFDLESIMAGVWLGSSLWQLWDSLLGKA